MQVREIDILNTLPTSKVHFILNPSLWDSFDDEIKVRLHETPIWNEAKFLDTNGSISGEMNCLPKDAGGIYLFVAKPNFIPNSHLYLMYVGRAHYTATQNIRKRCRGYINEQSRPKIKKMIEGWGKYLYIRYLPLTDNNLIDLIESEIINKILPPFNDAIPDKQIRDAVKAFSI